MNVLRRKTVPAAERLSSPHRIFGAAFPQIEAVVYAVTGNMAQDYRGAYWEFYLLSNGGFYLAPDLEQSFAISCSGNNYRGTLTADALGIVSCLFAYSHLSFAQDEQLGRLCAQHYHWLKPWAARHAEAVEIYAAID